MPLYELFCLARPSLAQNQLAEIIRKASVAVLQKGGVITNVVSYGDNELAYEIRKPGAKYDEAAMWGLHFMVTPKALPEVEHILKVDDRVLRWMFLKRRALPKFPNTHRIAQYAKKARVPTLPNPYETLFMKDAAQAAKQEDDDEILQWFHDNEEYESEEDDLEDVESQEGTVNSGASEEDQLSKN